MASALLRSSSRALRAAMPRHGLTASRLATIPPALRPCSAVHHLSTKAAASESTAYDVLGVQRGVDDETLKGVYKDLAREWHPDRHQGSGRAEAEQRFQEISEAYQTLSDSIRRAEYDHNLDTATTAAEKAKAAKRYRASTWNTEVPDVAARLRNAKKEEAGFPRHIIAGTLLFVTGNFILVLNWLGG